VTPKLCHTQHNPTIEVQHVSSNGYLPSSFIFTRFSTHLYYPRPRPRRHRAAASHSRGE